MMTGFLEDLRSLQARPTTHIKSMATQAVLAELSTAMRAFVAQESITEAESRELGEWFARQLEKEGLISSRRGNGLDSSEDAGGVSVGADGICRHETELTVEAVHHHNDEAPIDSPLRRRLERLARSIPEPDERPVLLRVIPLLREVEIVAEPATLVSLECWSHGYSMHMAIPLDESAFLDRPRALLKDAISDSWLEWEARDDRGGLYAGMQLGGSGERYWMRRHVWFTPPLDPDAGELTFVVSGLDEEQFTIARVALEND